MNCPRCGGPMEDKPVRNALSRVDNTTYICNDCGTAEAMADMQGQPLGSVNEPVPGQ